MTAGTQSVKSCIFKWGGEGMLGPLHLWNPVLPEQPFYIQKHAAMTLIQRGCEYSVSVKTLKALIAGLRTGKLFKIAGSASLLQVFTIVIYDVFTKYCQSSRTCKYFILPVHPLYCQPRAEDLQFSRKLYSSEYVYASVLHRAPLSTKSERWRRTFATFIH